MSHISPKEDKREKLPAEQKFDKAVYGGISYFAQAAAGIAFTYWLRFTPKGQTFFKPISEWLGKNVAEKFTSMRGAEAAKSSESFLTVSSQIMIGNLFIPPVKWLENRKPAIVRSLTESDNAKREAGGEVIPPEEKAHQEKLLGELENTPKQSWPSLIVGRAFALAAVYATIFAIGNRRNQMMEDFVSNTAREGLRMAGAKKAAENEIVDGTFKLIYSDLFYSTVSAGGLYAYSHFLHKPISRMFMGKKNPDTIKEEEGLTLLPMEHETLVAAGLHNANTPSQPHHEHPSTLTSVHHVMQAPAPHSVEASV